MASTVHFLNVRNGDCSIIQHPLDRVSVIDVSCAKEPMIYKKAIQMSANAIESLRPVGGNFNQKEHPDNPIEYLRKLKVTSIFRFISTHPDMDHLGGIHDLFSAFQVVNFWDTDNDKSFPPNHFESRPSMGADWNLYRFLRDTKPETGPRRLTYYSGNRNPYYDDDGITILAPTPELVARGNARRNWNDSSYVFLYQQYGKKILFSGDSEDETWRHILYHWPQTVSNVDVLIAPHHGRRSGRDYTFLDVLSPRLTLFGNADSEHQMYDACRNRNQLIFTNNQAGYIVLYMCENGLYVYVKHEPFARRHNTNTTYNQRMGGWYVASM